MSTSVEQCQTYIYALEMASYPIGPIHIQNLDSIGIPKQSLLTHAATCYAMPHRYEKCRQKLSDLVHRVNIMPAGARLPKAFSGEDPVGEEAHAAQLHPHLHGRLIQQVDLKDKSP